MSFVVDFVVADVVQEEEGEGGKEGGARASAHRRGSTCRTRRACRRRGRSVIAGSRKITKVTTPRYVNLVLFLVCSP